MDHNNAHGSSPTISPLSIETLQLTNDSKMGIMSGSGRGNEDRPFSIDYKADGIHSLQALVGAKKPKDLDQTMSLDMERSEPGSSSKRYYYQNNDIFHNHDIRHSSNLPACSVFNALPIKSPTLSSDIGSDSSSNSSGFQLKPVSSIFKDLPCKSRVGLNSVSPPLQRLRYNIATTPEPQTPSPPNTGSRPQMPLTDEERKHRNRLYAKKSRNLKNQKYLESIEVNKRLEARVKELQDENLKTKLLNQILQNELNLCRLKIANFEKNTQDRAST